MTTSHERARDILRDATFLGGLPEAALEQLARRVTIARFARGHTIYRRGDEGDSLMVILAGRVKISNVTADAHEVVLNFLGKGDVNGEIAVLDGQERTANATALEDTEALVLQRRDLIPVLKANPEAMLEIIALLCDKLRLASSMIEANTLDMSGRTASGLLRLARQHGRKVKDGVLIDLKLSQRDLGSYLGLSRENANRQLSALKERGVVRVEGAAITILDEAELAALAERESADR